MRGLSRCAECGMVWYGMVWNGMIMETGEMGAGGVFDQIVCLGTFACSVLFLCLSF